jgi:hypothetical protein
MKTRMQVVEEINHMIKLLEAAKQEALPVTDTRLDKEQYSRVKELMILVGSKASKLRVSL